MKNVKIVFCSYLRSKVDWFMSS